MPGAVLFDLDDTLTPRRACVERFAEIFAHDFAGRVEPMGREALVAALVECDQGGYNPRRAEDLRERLPWADAPDAGDLERHWLRRFPESVVPTPGLEDVLTSIAARGWRLGVVTNGGVRSQNKKIDLLGVRRLVDAVIISEGVGCAKPDPRIFQLACDELGVAADACWFVGDHPENDVLGAARFGMTAVWITSPAGGHTWPEPEEPPAYRIERLRELPALLPGA